MGFLLSIEHPKGEDVYLSTGVSSIGFSGPIIATREKRNSSIYLYLFIRYNRLIRYKGDEEMEKLNEYFTSIYYYLHPEQQQTITHQSVRILQLIQKEPDVTVRNVAEAFQISHNTASEHIKKLEQHGWVIKERSAKDQRVVHLSLSEQGMKIVKENTELDNEKLETVFSRLSVEQRNHVEEAFHLLSEVAKDVYGR